MHRSPCLTSTLTFYYYFFPEIDPEVDFDLRRAVYFWENPPRSFRKYSFFTFMVILTYSNHLLSSRGSSHQCHGFNGQCKGGIII